MNGNGRPVLLYLTVIFVAIQSFTTLFDGAVNMLVFTPLLWLCLSAQPSWWPTFQHYDDEVQ